MILWDTLRTLCRAATYMLNSTIAHYQPFPHHSRALLRMGALRSAASARSDSKHQPQWPAVTLQAPMRRRGCMHGARLCPISHLTWTYHSRHHQIIHCCCAQLGPQERRKHRSSVREGRATPFTRGCLSRSLLHGCVCLWQVQAARQNRQRKCSVAVPQIEQRCGNVGPITLQARARGSAHMAWIWIGVPIRSAPVFITQLDL